MKHSAGPAEHSDSPFNHVGREDLARMQTMRRSHRDEKWIPAWALDDKKLRLVIFNYAHHYARSAGVKNQPGASLREIERAALAARTQIETPEWLEHLRTSPNGFIGRATSILYKAYRQRLKAPDIAEQLDMSHRAVRGVLFRLNRLAKNLFSGRPRLVRVRTGERKGGRPKGSVGPNSGQFKPLVQIEGDLLQQVLNRRMQGASIPLIAEELNIPRVTLAHRLRKLHIADVRTVLTRPNATRFKPKFFLSQQQINEIASRWKGGESLESISRDCGIPFKPLRTRLYRLGITQRPKRCKI
jgi:hypothetical protein